MKRILNVEESIKQSEQLKSEGKKIILAGGCFDILHVGHVLFLEKAKEQGDVLFVWVESDSVIERKKGKGRPVHSQNERTIILSFLRPVDYVVQLPDFTSDQEYDELVKSLKPDIIATTNPDPAFYHKERSAKEIGAKVISVIKKIPNTSTSDSISRLQNKHL